MPVAPEEPIKAVEEPVEEETATEASVEDKPVEAEIAEEAETKAAESSYNCCGVF